MNLKIKKMKLNKSHKDKVIGGIIGIIILILTLYIKECFEKRSPKSDPQQTNSSTSIKSEDSSSQVIIQSQQSNSGSGSMSVENIGTKNVTQIESKQKIQPNNLSKRPEISIERNNGNINTGENKGIIGDNTTINVNPPVLQRHLTLEGIEDLKHILPRKKVDFYMSAYNYDSESMSYANEIVDYMKSKGYNWAVDAVGQTMGSPPIGKLGTVDVNISPDSSVYFTVYPIK
jgi:hypothetical protein